jgi:hypothetical protein
MKIKVTNKRPVSVVVAGRSFRPRSSVEIEVDARVARQIGAKYGLVVEQVVEAIVPRGNYVASATAAVLQAITCPECGRICKSDFGLKAHMRSHKES